MTQHVGAIEGEFLNAFSATSADLIKNQASFGDGSAALDRLREQFLRRPDVSIEEAEKIRRAIEEERFFYALRRNQSFEVCLALIDRLTWQLLPDRATFDLALCGHFLKGGEGKAVLGRLKVLAGDLEVLVSTTNRGGPELERAKAMLRRMQDAGIT